MCLCIYSSAFLIKLVIIFAFDISNLAFSHFVCARTLTLAFGFISNQSYITTPGCYRNCLVYEFVDVNRVSLCITMCLLRSQFLTRAPKKNSRYQIAQLYAFDRRFEVLFLSKPPPLPPLCKVARNENFQITSLRAIPLNLKLFLPNLLK